MSEEAKNKAIEIIEQHAFLLAESISLSNKNSQEYKACIFDLAKQSALITIDVLFWECKGYNSNRESFWQEVKNQIKSI